MNISLIKLLAMMSIFIGVLCGFLTALPFIGGWVFFILICGSAIIEMGMLMKIGVLTLDSIHESAAIGGIIGFLSFIAFSIVYMPLALILLKVFNYHTNYGVALALNNSNLWIIIFVSLFLAVLSATVNAFTGFLTYYVSELIKDLNKRQ